MLLALLLAAGAPSEPATGLAARSAPETGEVAGRGAGKRKRANYWRLLAHIKYENCVRTNALAIAGRDSPPETLARAALAFCREEEVSLWSNTVVECQDTGRGGRQGNWGGTCAEELMVKWRDIAEREAFGCIAGTRFKREAIGVSICKLADPDSARTLTGFSPSP
jgi:hypothetical protein